MKRDEWKETTEMSQMNKENIMALKCLDGWGGQAYIPFMLYIVDTHHIRIYYMWIQPHFKKKNDNSNSYHKIGCLCQMTPKYNQLLHLVFN